MKVAAGLPSLLFPRLKQSTPYAAGCCKPKLAGMSEGFLMHARGTLDCREQHELRH